MARNILKLLLNLFLLIVIISQFAKNSISVAKESGIATKREGGQQVNYSNASLYGSLSLQLLLRNKRMEKNKNDKSFLVDEQENDGNYGREGSRAEQGNKAQSLLDRLDPPKSHSSRHGTVPMPPKQQRRKVASLFDQDGDDKDENAVKSREMASLHRQDSLGRKKVDSLLENSDYAESLVVEADRQGRDADEPTMAPDSRKKADSLLAKKYATSLFIDGKGMESGGGGGPSTGNATSILRKTKADSLLSDNNKNSGNKQYATSLFDTSAPASSSFANKPKVRSLLDNDDDDDLDKPASQPNPPLRRSASTRQSSTSTSSSSSRNLAQSLLGNPIAVQTAIRGGEGGHRRVHSSAGYAQKNETEYLLIPHAVSHGQSSSGVSKSGTEHLLLNNDYVGQKQTAISSNSIYTVQLKWDYWLQPNKKYILAFFDDAKDKYDKVKFRFNCLIETNENGQFGLTQMRDYAGCQYVKDYFRFVAVVYPKNVSKSTIGSQKRMEDPNRDNSFAHNITIDHSLLSKRMDASGLFWNKSDKRILNYFEHYKDLKNYDKDKYPLNSLKTKKIINFENLVSPQKYYDTKLEDWQKEKMGMKKAFYEKLYADN